MVTTREIAEAAGLAQSTVSMALRGDKRIKDSTRARVRKIAEELGYIPDPAMAAISHRRWHGIKGKVNIHLAVIIDDLNGARRERGEQLFAQVAATSQERGYTCEAIRLWEYGDDLDLAALLTRRGIRGCIIGPVISRFSVISRTDWSKFAVVQLGGGRVDPGCDRVNQDYGQCVVQSVRKLAERGARRLGLWVVQHRPPALDDMDQVGAWERCKFTHPELKFLPIFLSERNLERPFKRWWNQHQPDGIIGFNSGIIHLVNLVSDRSKPPPLITYLRGHAVNSPEHGILVGGYENDSAFGIAEALGYLERRIVFAEDKSKTTLAPFQRRLTLIEPVWVPAE